MFCPKCGRINPDENEVCKGCGAVLHTEDEKAVKKTKGGFIKKLIIALVVIALICLAAFVIFKKVIA